MASFLGFGTLRECLFPFETACNGHPDQVHNQREIYYLSVHQQLRLTDSEVY